MLILYIIIYLKISLCLVIFPFKLVEQNNNDDINQDKKEYNYSHFMNEYFIQLNYIIIEIGNPPQELKILLIYQDCGFKIGKSKKCINNKNYLSYYNRNISFDFNYTNYYNMPMKEFDGKGNSAEDSIYAYIDINLKNYTKLNKICFYLGSDTNESLCGIIGFKMDNYDESQCSKINDLIRSFKSNKIISNYQWNLKYISKNEGLLIFGWNEKDLISNFNEEKLFIANSIINSSNYNWGFEIEKIICGEDNYTINIEGKRAEINNDFGLIQGSSSYYNYIEKNFFKEYFNNKICAKNMWYQNIYFQYFIIECDKKNLEWKRLKNFQI